MPNSNRVKVKLLEGKCANITHLQSHGVHIDQQNQGWKACGGTIISPTVVIGSFNRITCPECINQYNRNPYFYNI